MITCRRTNSEDFDFNILVKELDAELKIVDGAEHGFYSQYNKIDSIKYVIVAYDDNTPVGCGAIKQYSPEATEIKRMYVVPHKRGKGVGTIVLTELENWAKELNYKKCLLETGKRQPDAIRLYTKNGYELIPNYGQYEGVENSVCFGKGL
ncbi:MAG TPA: GNAT family N-acetyltransferase [Bacteroidia bacterium]|jgi:putative acetyltransferase|nr:GNAT family N-acetyltransferase [Bacteroidia bacterium]